jgi:hypothetical protein
LVNAASGVIQTTVHPATSYRRPGGRLPATETPRARLSGGPAPAGPARRAARGGSRCRAW